MQTAQRLYENGYITYMRTDSTALSTTAVTAARDQAAALYGAEYVPPQPRRHDRKVKNAQEAHEAIRPAGESFRRPDQVAGDVSQDEARLYDLVWKRTVASQMADANGMSVQVRLAGVAASPDGTPAAGERAEFAASGKVITFPGFLRAYVEGADDPEAELEDREVHLPRLADGDALEKEALEARGHATQPPARYTEASLVKALEELGVGRPSTYATIISTIQDRATSGRREARSSRRSSPLPWSGCWSVTSPTWSTTGSRPAWRTTSTRSPTARRRRCPGSTGSTSATASPGSRRASRGISTRSTPAR
jgi:DNA topoisomerase-1